MEPIYPHNLHDHIAQVVVTFIDTGATEVLTTKPGSANHFFERFSVGDDDVQLRLDWTSRDDNGLPTLDANFINRTTGKERKLKGRRRDAHHTAPTPGEYLTYEWEFDGHGRHMKVAITWKASVVESLNATDSCDAVYIPAATSTFNP